jgi:uncharacterized membrane protein YkvA (DUF1232 family)
MTKKPSQMPNSKSSAASKRSTEQASSSTPQKSSATKKTAQSGAEGVTPDDVRSSEAYRKAESKAKQYAKDPEKMKQLFEDAAKKSKSARSGLFGETWAYLQAMIRLVRAYSNGSYREIPIGSLVSILVAVIYFVSPIDFIPDVIPIAGLVDDAIVAGFVLKMVRDDLDAFMEWELS